MTSHESERAEAAEDGEGGHVVAAAYGTTSGRARACPRSGIVCRIQITDACASVNESIAPNAYRLPRNVMAPFGIISRIAITL